MDFPHLDRELCRNMAATILTSALASAALRWDALDRRAAVSAALSPALPALLASPVQPAAAVQNSVPVFGSRGLRDSLESPDEEAYKRRYEAVKPDLSGVVLPSSFTGARDVAIIFHGSGGQDRETADMASRMIAQDAAVGLRRPIEVFDWMTWFTADTDRLCFVRRPRCDLWRWHLSTP
jgi:hypothetical protein